MPKVTLVQPQKKSASRRTHRFNIFLDGQFAFGADEDLVVEYRLVIGKIIDTPLLEKLLFEAEVGKLMERMYNLFTIRQRSEREIRDYFRVKNLESRIKDRAEISDLVIELVIKKLKHKRMLNDEEFARAWVQSRSRKKGIQAIKSELYKKGIDKETIDQVIDKSSISQQEQVATKLLQKRLPRFSNLPCLQVKNKSIQFLMARGFEYDLVKNVVENILKKE